MRRLLGMCVDPRVLGALALVGVATWLYAPGLVAAALPVLLLLVCPLSMLLMAWTMRGPLGSAQRAPLSTADRLAALEREQARLNAEIASARAELGGTAERAPEAQA